MLKDATVGLMLAAHTYNPRSYANNARLEQIYETRGDRAQMIVLLRDLAASGPVNARLYIDLARLLVETGKTIRRWLFCRRPSHGRTPRATPVP